MSLFHHHILSNLHSNQKALDSHTSSASISVWRTMLPFLLVLTFRRARCDAKTFWPNQNL